MNAVPPYLAQLGPGTSTRLLLTLVHEHRFLSLSSDQPETTGMSHYQTEKSSTIHLGMNVEHAEPPLTTTNEVRSSK